MQAIKTTFKGPTNANGARIVSGSLPGTSEWAHIILDRHE